MDALTTTLLRAIDSSLTGRRRVDWLHKAVSVISAAQGQHFDFNAYKEFDNPNLTFDNLSTKDRTTLARIIYGLQVYRPRMNVFCTNAIAQFLEVKPEKLEDLGLKVQRGRL